MTALFHITNTSVFFTRKLWSLRRRKKQGNSSRSQWQNLLGRNQIRGELVQRAIISYVRCLLLLRYTFGKYCFLFLHCYHCSLERLSSLIWITTDETKLVSLHPVYPHTTSNQKSSQGLRRRKRESSFWEIKQVQKYHFVIIFPVVYISTIPVCFKAFLSHCFHNHCPNCYHATYYVWKMAPVFENDTLMVLLILIHS